MRLRTSPLIVGALLVAGSAVAQQDTTRRSTSRIPITKGEPTRVDTLTIQRTDTVTRTITRRIHDTVRVTKHDTVKTAPGEVAIPFRIHQIGGWYIGVATGPAIPTGTEFTTFQGTGWHVEAPIGWDQLTSPIGVRLTPAYSQFGKKGVFDQIFTTPEIFHTDLDLKLRFPIQSPWMRRFQVYGLGGLTYAAYRSIAQFDNATGIITVGDSTGRSTAINFGFPSNVDNNWHSAWGWNAGGGLLLGWERANVFIESRFIQFSHNSFTMSQVPIVIGASWF
ncbi:MAG: hypothetical protein ACREPM_14980 [Gemmatimonadaceae bacterium]